jgi:hypothetical protein
LTARETGRADKRKTQGHCQPRIDETNDSGDDRREKELAAVRTESKLVKSRAGHRRVITFFLSFDRLESVKASFSMNGKILRFSQRIALLIRSAHGKDDRARLAPPTTCPAFYASCMV